MATNHHLERLAVDCHLFFYKPIYIINGVFNSATDIRIVFLLIKQLKDSLFFYFPMYSCQMTDTRDR